MSVPDFAAMNRQMTERLLGEPGAPLPDEGYALRVLEVPGRTTGEVRQTPIGLLVHDGGHYLVCPDRNRDWPANIAAAGRCAIRDGSTAVDYRAEELHGPAAAEAVAAYLRHARVPWAVAAFRLPPDPSVEAIVPELGRMAVFALHTEPAAG